MRGCHYTREVESGEQRASKFELRWHLWVIITLFILFNRIVRGGTWRVCTERAWVKQAFDLNTFMRACGPGLYFVNVNDCCIVDTVSQMFREYTTKALINGEVSGVLRQPRKQNLLCAGQPQLTMKTYLRMHQTEPQTHS